MAAVNVKGLTATKQQNLGKRWWNCGISSECRLDIFGCRQNNTIHREQSWSSHACRPACSTPCPKKV